MSKKILTAQTRTGATDVQIQLLDNETQQASGENKENVARVLNTKSENCVTNQKSVFVQILRH